MAKVKRMGAADLLNVAATPAAATPQRASPEKKVPVQVMLPAGLARAVKIKAAERGQTITQLVAGLLAQAGIAAIV